MERFEFAGRARLARGVSLRRCCVAAWLACTPLWAQPETQPALAQTPLTLAEAVAIATTQSRRVTASELQAQAARDMAVAATQRPDPVLKFGLSNLPIDGADRFSLTNDFMTMRSVGVMQEFVPAEKRQARGARAQREVDAALLARAQTINEVQRDTALAWLERSYQHTLRDLLQAQVHEAELQVQAVQALLGSARASQADHFAARGQVEQMRDGVAQADRAIGVADAQLARWIGDSAQRSSDTRPPLTAPDWTMHHDLSAQLARHPLIAAAVQQEALTQADAELARAEQRTDWSIEVMFSQRGPSYSNMVSINVALPLPWNRVQRQGREYAARQALAARSSAEREDVQRAHEAEVRVMLHEWRNHEQRLQRFQAQLLPLAQQRSVAALTAYRAGSGMLGAVLDARRAELEVRVQQLRIEMDLARLWAQLTYLDGQAPASTPRNTP